MDECSFRTRVHCKRKTLNFNELERRTVLAEIMRSRGNGESVVSIFIYKFSLSLSPAKCRLDLREWKKKWKESGRRLEIKEESSCKFFFLILIDLSSLFRIVRN